MGHRADDARDGGGRPGLITKTGLHTFVDPRQRGARQSASAKEDLVELLTVDGQEWLRFKPFPLDVVLLRGTTADEDGNISMEQEAIPGEMHSSAQAARSGWVPPSSCRSSGGSRRRGTLPQRSVKIPASCRLRRVRSEPAPDLLDRLRSQLFGEIRVPLEAMRKLPFTERKIIARRAAMEMRQAPSATSAQASRPATPQSRRKRASSIRIVLTNEQGYIGGAPITGPCSGGRPNYDAMVDQPYQFDF